MTVNTAQKWWKGVRKRETLRSKMDYTKGFVRGYYLGYKSKR